MNWSSSPVVSCLFSSANDILYLSAPGAWKLDAPIAGSNKDTSVELLTIDSVMFKPTLIDGIESYASRTIVCGKTLTKLPTL